MFTRLTPILPVVDVQQEVAFYEQLGFDHHTDPTETGRTWGRHDIRARPGRH